MRGGGGKKKQICGETQQDCCALRLRLTQIPIRQTENGVKVQQRATKKLLCEGGGGGGGGGGCGGGGGHAHKRDETSCAAKRLRTKRLQGGTQFVCYFCVFKVAKNNTKAESICARSGYKK